MTEATKQVSTVTLSADELSTSCSLHLDELTSAFKKRRFQKLMDIADNVSEFIPGLSRSESSFLEEASIEIFPQRPFEEVRREWKLKREQQDQLSETKGFIELVPTYVYTKGCLTLVFVPKETVDCTSTTHTCSSLSAEISDISSPSSDSVDNESGNESSEFMEYVPAYTYIKGCLTLVYALKDILDCTSASSSSGSLNKGNSRSLSPPSNTAEAESNNESDDTEELIHRSLKRGVFPYHFDRYYDPLRLQMWRETSVYYF